MTNLTQTTQKVIQTLSELYPWEAKTFQQLAEVCYLSGKSDERNETILKLAQRLNPTIPDNADLWQEGQPEVEVL